MSRVRQQIGGLVTRPNQDQFRFSVRCSASGKTIEIFELFWKLRKDYQQAQGYDIASPRDAIKQDFQNGTITDGGDWMRALDDRDLTTHTYNEATAFLVAAKLSWPAQPGERSSSQYAVQ